MIFLHEVGVLTPVGTVDENRQVKTSYVESFRIKGYFQSLRGGVVRNQGKREVVSTHVLYCGPGTAIDENCRISFGKTYEVTFVDRLKDHVKVELKSHE